MAESHDELRLCLFGAAGDNSNLGIRALMTAVVTGVRSRVKDSDITVFDDGFGIQMATVNSGAVLHRYRRAGARRSRRFHRPESYWNMRMAMRSPLWPNRGADLIRRADAVLDVTGGDSFTDLYGRDRIEASLAPKDLSLQAGRPLILLPQAYGPFTERDSKRRAAAIVAGARQAWARDATSYSVLADLLGEDFDPDRHRLGVDVAFGLERRQPPEPDVAAVAEFKERAGGAPVVGMNVSGLLYNASDAGERFGLKASYRDVSVTVLRRLLADDGASVILVNHVLAPAGSHEADRTATKALLGHLSSVERARVLVVSDPGGPGEAKWFISQCEWFVGARMHATIAALSSGVPAAVIAYSHKARGVFETCGLGSDVAHLDADPAAVAEIVWESYRLRDLRRQVLAGMLPGVRAQADRQLDEVVAACRQDRESGHRR